MRPADDGDVEAIAAIYVTAARAGWAHIFDEPSPKAMEPPADRLRAELRVRPTPRQQAARRRTRRASDRLRGSSGRLETRTPTASGSGELDQFYSAPAVWGLGAGRKLLAAACETLRENGFSEATLWVAEENHRPRQIYESAGWTLDGATRDKSWRGVRVRDLRYRITL